MVTEVYYFSVELSGVIGLSFCLDDVAAVSNTATQLFGIFGKYKIMILICVIKHFWYHVVVNGALVGSLSCLNGSYAIIMGGAI